MCFEPGRCPSGSVGPGDPRRGPGSHASARGKVVGKVVGKVGAVLILPSTNAHPLLK